MYMWTKGSTIATAQVVGILLCLAVSVSVRSSGTYVLFATLAVALGPVWWIEQKRAERVRAIEAQIDAFLVALSNALKVTPSIGDAFKSVASIVRDPLRQEIETALKEIRFGATLDQALALMGARVGSPQLDSALSCILIGRQVGGNLPKVLDTSAASLREMSRLEGVIRTKTADGKMQAWVLAVFPLFLVISVSVVMPGYFDPMTKTSTGLGLTGLAVLLWGAAIVASRNILTVDK
jgi:tight adherence protein B